MRVPFLCTQEVPDMDGLDWITAILVVIVVIVALLCPINRDK